MLPARRNNQNWMPSIFNDFFGDDFMSLTPAKQFATPAVNITENEKNYEIEVAAPGLTKDDIKVNVDNGNELAISYEKRKNRRMTKRISCVMSSPTLLSTSHLYSLMKSRSKASMPRW